jgi:hypothetical protein
MELRGVNGLTSTWLHWRFLAKDLATYLQKFIRTDQISTNPNKKAKKSYTIIHTVSRRSVLHKNSWGAADIRPIPRFKRGFRSGLEKGGQHPSVPARTISGRTTVADRDQNKMVACKTWWYDVRSMAYLITRVFSSRELVSPSGHACV